MAALPDTSSHGNTESSSRPVPSRPVDWAKWMREPLLHFVLLGGLLFALDYFIVGQQDDPRTIFVDANVDQQARQVFKQARGQNPNADEARALRQVWLDNEVLYREGLARGVDKGDDVIRERVIFKMLSVIEAGLKLPPVDDGVLRQWFDNNRSRYDEPARYDFHEAVLAGERSEAPVRAFVETLDRGGGGDVNAGLRVFKGRPHATVVQAYGEDFTRALAESTVGKWRALPTRDGWRAVQVIAVAPGKAADFESLRGVVLQDWKDATMAELRTAAVRALAKNYDVRVQAPAQ